MNAKKQTIAEVWSAGHLKNPSRTFRVNTSVEELASALSADPPRLCVVAYTIPNRLEATYSRLTLTAWKKFHKNVLELKKRHVDSLQIVPLDTLSHPNQTSQDTSLLTSAFDLLLREPLLFEIWSQIEGVAELNNRQPIRVSTLLEVIAPGSAALKSKSLELEMHQKKFDQISADLAVMLTNSHRLQDSLDQVENQLHVQQTAQKQCESDKQALQADLMTINQMLHRLQEEIESLENENALLKSSAVNAKANENQAQLVENAETHRMNQKLKEDVQRLEEQLMFTREELARQHAIANLYVFESVQSEKILSQVQGYLLEQLGVPERT